MRRWGTALLGLLVLAGCSGGGGPTTEPAALAGPGTPLGAGFVVPAGTRLLGAIGRPQGLDEPGFRALLHVDGDPESAARDAVAQARAAGLRLRGGCGGQREGISQGCSIVAIGLEDGYLAERLVVGMLVTTAAADGYASEMELFYEQWPSRTLRPGPAASDPYGGIDPFPADLPPAPPVPDVDELMPQSRITEDDEFRVVPGTRVVAPVRTFGVCNGGFSAQLQVTGELDEVLDETRRRLIVVTGGDESRITETDEDGHRVIRLHVAGYNTAAMVVRVGGDGEPTWATLSYCQD